MSWFGLSDDERREWRSQATTQAFFAEIRSQINMTRDEVVSSLLDEKDTAANEARRMAGRVDGMETVIKIMEAD